LLRLARWQRGKRRFRAYRPEGIARGLPDQWVITNLAQRSYGARIVERTKQLYRPSAHGGVASVYE
jgi:hypothetical protein